MNPVAANRLKMMLAAGKRRLEVKAAKSKEERKLARAERVLARYQEVHGPFNHETPETVLSLARLVAHHRALLNAHYRYWFKTGTVHTDHLPAPAPDPPAKKKKFDYSEYKTRQLEERAADPEKFAREKAVDRRQRNQFWERYTEGNHFDKANEALREDRLDHLPADAVDLTGEALQRFRVRDIWGEVWNADQAAKIDRLHLRQEDRIFNARHAPRVRGAGRAAKLAGF